MFNSTESNQSDQSLLGIANGKRTPGQFLNGDYEYCPSTQGTSHCYTLWSHPQNGDDRPMVIKQGKEFDI